MDEPLRLVVAGRPVVRIRVEHLPASISTRARLTAAELAKSPDARRLTIDRSPEVERLVAEANKIIVRRDSQYVGYDCRWSFRFERAHGAIALTCDDFGRRGAVEATDCDFVATSASEFLGFVASAYPALMRDD